MRAAWKARFRAERRGLYMAKSVLNDIRKVVGEPEEWAPGVLKERKGRLFKASKDDQEFVSQFTRLLADAKGTTPDVLFAEWIDSAAGAHAAFGLSIGEDAGQYTLETLGLDRTFKWSHPRQVHQDVFAPRGEQILRGVFGTHMSQIARIITAATAPGSPWTIGAVTTALHQAWPGLTDMQARRIARTETAWAWEQVNSMTMRANGIQKARWLVATGPSIGKVVGGRFVGPVCEICLGNAAEGWIPLGYAFSSGHTSPPGHPNCRCTLVPQLEDWLPPSDPWTGGPLDLTTGRPLPDADREDDFAALLEDLDVELADIQSRIFLPISERPTLPVSDPATDLVRAPMTIGQLFFPVGQPVIWTAPTGKEFLGVVTWAPDPSTGLFRVKFKKPDELPLKHKDGEVEFFDNDPAIRPIWLTK
jgi:hypothetical protein